MNELKTINEISIRIPIAREHAFPKEAKLRSDAERDLILTIRKEAIKWIKEMEQKRQCSERTSDTVQFNYGIRLFKDFFDITEEDGLHF